MRLINGDCLEIMETIEDASIDLILCDLPYGTTSHKWDSIIPLDELWGEYERIIKPNGAIVLFGSSTFTHKLVSSNFKLFKYKCVWIKTRKGGFINAKNRPLTLHEDILIFSKGTIANGSPKRMIYNPQGIKKCNKVVYNTTSDVIGERPNTKKKQAFIQEATNYPTDVLYFDSLFKTVHPTQKPTELLEYLIKTYTNEGDLVLDNTMGSGSTGVACVNTNRDFIGIELDETYFNIAKKRIEEANICK